MNELLTTLSSLSSIISTNCSFIVPGGYLKLLETVRVKDLLLDEFEAIDDVDEVGDDASDDSSCILSHRLFLADTVPDLPSSFYRDNETKRKKMKKFKDHVLVY